MMSRTLLSFSFLLSAVLLPWWVSVPLGLAVLVFCRGYVTLVLGGLLMDMGFGGGSTQFLFSYIYTLSFLILAVAAWQLNRTMLG